MTQKQPSDQQRKFIAVVNLIDMVTPRGAFRGEELEEVAALRKACLEEYKEFLQPPSQQEPK